MIHLEFRREQTHLAILKDEYGEVEGIVTRRLLNRRNCRGNRRTSPILIVSHFPLLIDEFHWEIDGGMTLDKFNVTFNESVRSRDGDHCHLMIQIIGQPDDDERLSVRVNDYVLTTTQIENGHSLGAKHTTLSALWPPILTSQDFEEEEFGDEENEEN